MVHAAEEALERLEFEFIRNGTDILAEFEIMRPTYFRIVVEPNKMPKVRNVLFIPSISAGSGSTIDIRFHTDSEMLGADVSEASINIRRFLKLVVDSLPKKPWNGLERNWGQEEKRWRSIIEG